MRLPDPALSRVVLIGASTFDDQRLPDVPAVANNVEDLLAYLTGPKTGVFAAENSVVIVDEKNMAGIGRRIGLAADAAQDTLLVYYSGHGCLEPRRNGLHLALRETDPDSLGFSAINIEVLRDAIHRSHAVNKVLILDCCFSGRAVESLSDATGVIDGQIEIEGTMTIAASSGSTVARVLSGERNTAFTGRLLSILYDNSIQFDRALDLNGVCQRLMRTMAREALPTPRWINSGSVGGLILSRGAVGRSRSDRDDRARRAGEPTGVWPEVTTVHRAGGEANPWLRPVHEEMAPLPAGKPAPARSSIKDRQRAAARARLEKEMIERAVAERRRRQWQMVIGGLFAIALIIAVSYLIFTLTK